MTDKKCLEGRRSVQLSYRGKLQKQKASNGFPLCFLALNQIKAVASPSSPYAEVCSDMLRSERKGVLRSVLFRTCRNVSTDWCTFLKVFFINIQNIRKQIV